MDGIKKGREIGMQKVKHGISAEEMARRREHVRIADAENRLEGIFRDAESDAVFESYIRGEIEVTDIVPRLKAQLGLQ